MRSLNFIAAALLFMSVGIRAQQCSKGSYQLFQDDKSISGPCNISVLFGDTVTVKETQGYNLSCTTTDGNSNPGNIYFTNSVSLSATGQRYCGTLLDPPQFCDPDFTMTATQATSTNDFNRFTFVAKDRSTGVVCVVGAIQSIFRQCAGQPCDAGGSNACTSPTVSDFGTVQDTPTSCDPIILDLTGNGFDLTDTSGGVVFDIHANGQPIRVPWTAAGSNTAFLVLDRNGNGVIDDASELFSSTTPQPAGTGKTGFRALAQYDRPENGGNGDGVIDSKDAIFTKLQLWIDTNHDGISQPEELHTLGEVGVFSIDLDIQPTNKTDKYGNVFLFRTKVNRGDKSDVTRKAYDVFFVNR